MVLRANMSFDENLLNRVDEEAKKMGLSRSAFVAVALNQYFVQLDNVKAVKDMKSMMDKLEQLTQINIDDLS